MKSIFTNVIKKGGYDLAAMLAKIDGYHIEGKLTDQERDELYEMARATPRAQYNYSAEVENLWAAVKKLTAAVESLQNGGNADEGSGTGENTIKDFVQPTGAHDVYMIGDTVRYKGAVYKSIIDNNSWAPDVYPAGWVAVEN